MVWRRIREGVRMTIAVATSGVCGASSNVPGTPSSSLNFVAASSQYLSMTDANFGAFNRALFSYNAWYKFNTIPSVAGNNMVLIAQQDAAGVDVSFQIKLNSSNKVDIFVFSAGDGSAFGRLTTTASFASTSAWHHLLFWYDSANATAGNRMRLWMDGVEITAFDNDINPTAAAYNSVTPVQVGALHSDSWFMDGKIYQQAFRSGSLSNISDVYNAGHPVALTEAFYWSILDAAGGDVTHDKWLPNWINNNIVTASSTIPT